MVKVYLARAMSGRQMDEVVKEAAKDRGVFGWWRIAVLDPVKAEGVKAKKQPLQATKQAMDSYWKRDKEMIREAHVFVDCTPHLKSQGVEREAGYARYSLWKPVVRIFPFECKPHAANAAYYEDDLIVDSFPMACKEITERWGTRWKRTKWRMALINRCLIRWIKFQIGEWK